MNKEDSDYWIADTKTYNTIQKLKKFVEFVAGLKDTTTEDRQKAQKIIELIEKINQPNSFKNWNVCLDIFDRDIQNRTTKVDGVYWRKWWVFFESQTIEIEAETRHSGDPLEHYSNDFQYFAAIYFKKEYTHERVDMKVDIDEFIKDARNYKSYITATLKDIEIEIEIE
ncbi:MAG: hypothetical protein CVT95_13210 [Bacteroidetes bacterium HGW-Bacteroidetes-12]|nr:MAG: hypothetical protein CVT95_13210 [Bacteroidetes bacterium HGW-Bacteroidetes-12]